MCSEWNRKGFTRLQMESSRLKETEKAKSDPEKTRAGSLYEGATTATASSEAILAIFKIWLGCSSQLPLPVLFPANHCHFFFKGSTAKTRYAFN